MAGRKGSPYPGNPPHDRPVSRGISSSLKENLRRFLPRHRVPQLPIILGAQDAFFQGMAESFWSDGVSQSKTILGRDHTASRWSAPSPGKRTRREDHALSHRPQMSSGRLFLDRVGRHQSPSPLRRHAEPTMHFPRGTLKPELSTLLGSGTFYFALTLNYLFRPGVQAGRCAYPLAFCSAALRCIETQSSVGAGNREPCCEKRSSAYLSRGFRQRMWRK